MSLTPRQEKFAVGVASGLSQAQAYREAYPSALKWKDSAVDCAGSKMAAIGKVSERVKELQAASAEIAELNGAEIMREIKRVAMSDIGGIIGADGRVLMPNELDAATRAAVSSFKIDEFGRIEYKFWDKNTALTNASKIKGLFKLDNEQAAPKVFSTIELVGVRPKDPPKDPPKA